MVNLKTMRPVDSGVARETRQITHGAEECFDCDMQRRAIYEDREKIGGTKQKQRATVYRDN